MKLITNKCIVKKRCEIREGEQNRNEAAKMEDKIDKLDIRVED